MATAAKATRHQLVHVLWQCTDSEDKENNRYLHRTSDHNEIHYCLCAILPNQLNAGSDNPGLEISIASRKSGRG